MKQQKKKKIFTSIEICCCCSYQAQKEFSGGKIFFQFTKKTRTTPDLRKKNFLFHFSSIPYRKINQFRENEINK